MLKLKKKKSKKFYFKPFSLKQKKVLTWWCDGSPYKNWNGIIADGAIRSGKTVSMALSYILWSWTCFSEHNFAMCGNTISSFKRNVWLWLKIILFLRGFKIKKCTDIGENIFFIHKKRKGNYYYIFGGKDESSYKLIQGITLAGVLFDEVALMPESFVNQATGRCSISNSKFWFNCNPEGPYHYFKINWIDKAKGKKLLYFHFTMSDNLSLSEQIKERYRSMFSGVFFKRYILGLWVIAEGIIYDMFNEKIHLVDCSNMQFSEYYISCDYGTYNALSFGLWGYNPKDKIWYKYKNYYYSGKEKGIQKDDSQYYIDLETFIRDNITKERFLGNIPDEIIKEKKENEWIIKKFFYGIVIDPSASSFIATIRNNGDYDIIKADNDVLEGIRNMSTALNTGLIKFDKNCIESIKEFYSYKWDDKAAERGEDSPIKQFDHTKDEERYFVQTVLFGVNQTILY